MRRVLVIAVLCCAAFVSAAWAEPPSGPDAGEVFKALTLATSSYEQLEAMADQVGERDQRDFATALREAGRDLVESQKQLDRSETDEAADAVIEALSTLEFAQELLEEANPNCCNDVVNVVDNIDSAHDILDFGKRGRRR